jgi:hypothetical protein
MKIQRPASIWNVVIFFLLVGSAIGQEQTVEKPLTGKGVIFDASGQAQTANLVGRRDLTKYADGGHFKFKYFSLEPDERSKDFSSLAKFLVDRLEGKHLAYARATFMGIDAGATYHFFVEPDRSGEWAVTTRMVGWHALPNGNRIVDFPRAYRLEKVEHDARIIEVKFFGKSDQGIETLKIK